VDCIEDAEVLWRAVVKMEIKPFVPKTKSRGVS
jgi:hypothetical protein